MGGWEGGAWDGNYWRAPSRPSESEYLQLGFRNLPFHITPLPPKWFSCIMNFDNGRTLYWLFRLKLPQEDGTFGGNRNSSWSRIWGQHPWGGWRSKCACLCWHLLVESNISSKCSSPQTTKVFSLMDAMILRVLHFSVWILTMMIIPKAPGIWGGGNTCFYICILS